MENEFVSYEIALALKELGFDEPCFAYYNGYKELDHLMPERVVVAQDYNGEHITSAPLYQQCWRWFREKYDLHSYIDRVYGKGFYVYEYFIDKDNQCFNLKRYEEAELECLKKLIEIVKAQK